jgi:ABC-type antimicrobial peptide transport system permease subunit
VGGGDTNTQIVGIVKDSRFSDLREEPAHFIYVPFEQGGGDNFIRRSAFFVRTSGNDAGMMAAVRESVKQLDRNLPIERLTSMETTIDNAMYAERLMSMLAIAFGLLAALLAAVGLYGTVSYAVARRTREFGIRLVLGAAPHSLLLSVMREVGWLIAIGVAVGLPASLALSRLAESEFFGVRAYDPWAIGAAILLILIVGLLAGLVPALRAMRIEPVRALRYE